MPLPPPNPPSAPRPHCRPRHCSRCQTQETSVQSSTSLRPIRQNHQHSGNPTALGNQCFSFSQQLDAQPIVDAHFQSKALITGRKCFLSIKWKSSPINEEGPTVIAGALGVRTNSAHFSLVLTCMWITLYAIKADMTGHREMILFHLSLEDG
ncbi:hypothetical protein NE237_023134 [Protea cynaroides]|uniref:Uncharacterized protein n=1 Tax=Protea cynaroides TaxID=273540 RepID=A0A9Q0HCC7_9MAGN|nr:hypothetical protein NE237_023134 [Protea cynaroides]